MLAIGSNKLFYGKFDASKKHLKFKGFEKALEGKQILKITRIGSASFILRVQHNTNIELLRLDIEESNLDELLQSNFPTTHEQNLLAISNTVTLLQSLPADQSVTDEQIL